MKIVNVVFAFFTMAFCFAQELTVTGKTYNPSSQINDGVVELTVDGGVSPYNFKWSNQETPQSSKRASGLVEGVAYSVIITDAEGTSVTKVFKVETEAITEIFNGAMTPAVSALGSVLFWDPFAALGIYDPVAYTDMTRIPIPNWSPDMENK